MKTKKTEMPADARYHVSMVSANRKTGPIAVTTSGRQTCPTTCGLYGKCYATMTQLHYFWNNVTFGLAGTDWDTHIENLKKIPPHRPVRVNQAGDLPGDNVTIDHAKLQQMTEALGFNARRKAPAWTYTHKPMNDANKIAVVAANKGGFTVNLSADNMAMADDLYDTKAGPVVVIVKLGTPNTSTTPKGRKVVKCPAQYRDGVTCETCLLCAKGNRSVIVGFEAHAKNKKAISAIAGG